MSDTSLRVLMADDHPIVLAGLKALVQADPGLLIIGEARDGRTALRLALSQRPDVVVLDISMPEMNGMEVARALLAEQPECRILVLTVQEDRATLRQLLDLGVAGYLVKPTNCCAPFTQWRLAERIWIPQLPGRSSVAAAKVRRGHRVGPQWS
jgi:DNA-binding NarL/FixJ family response regulator